MNQPKKFSEITDQDVYQAYLETPAINKIKSWDAVQKDSGIYRYLKMLVPHQTDPTFSSIPSSSQIFMGTMRKRGIDTVTEKNDKQKGVFLHKKQLDKITTALRMAKNCLQCPELNFSLRTEAIEDLTMAQQLLSGKTSALPNSRTDRK